MVRQDSVSLPDLESKPSQKKPRHRHSPAQLAALNQLFDQDEHPSLETRSVLAERLGMEAKTVNAWFQNKRASTKKRSKGAAPVDAQPANPMPVQYPPPSYASNHPEFDDYLDEDYPLPPSAPYSRGSSVLAPDLPPFYHTNNVDSSYYMAEGDAARRMRLRPSPDQAEELKRLYIINPHPTSEERQALAERIGMRYQSITNWFQNQRSSAKKRREDEAEISISSKPPCEHDMRQYSAFPPPTQHPSLPLPPLPIQPPSLTHQNLRRSPSLPPMDDMSPRRAYSRRSTTPYGSMPISFSRPRRSRPEPYQLDALKELFRKTSTPTIEERSALALEIGMDVGKVTNWFRNLRQTARKRAKKSGSGDDEEYSHSSISAAASRSGTPSLGSSSSSSSVHDETTESHVIDDDYDMQPVASDIGSDEDYQEILTPSPDHSPSPVPITATDATSSISTVGSMSSHTTVPDSPYYAELEKVSATRYSGIRIEDALLLLSFHQHVIH